MKFTRLNLEIITDSTGVAELAIPVAAVQQDGLTPIMFRRDPTDHRLLDVKKRNQILIGHRKKRKIYTFMIGPLAGPLKKVVLSKLKMLL